jgi:hypothetical protein
MSEDEVRVDISFYRDQNGDLRERRRANLVRKRRVKCLKLESPIGA